MSTELLYLLIGLIAIAIGLFLGMYIQQLKTKSNQGVWQERESQLNNTLTSLNDKLIVLDEDKKGLQFEKEQLGNKIVRYEADLENLQWINTEHKQEVEKLQEKFTKEFENLANKILDEKSEKFTKRNEENIKNILNPLEKKIKEFEGKVQESQEKNISIHAALKQQLESLKNQNLKITQEAENLTKALKGDSKMQGNWGELVLERVLEKSGLEKDREYSVQQIFTRDDGTRVLPDVIIHLPDGKKMIVDSKVSLTDYERYINADDDLKEKHLKDHINSLRKHIEQLSAKKYEDLYEMESPDFVLLFIPIEPAFAVAINHDNTMYNKAFEQNIVIVTPSTLLATLRTIDTMWNNEKQQKNAIEIARQAGALYDKFEGFVSDLTKVGKKMDEAKTEYKGAMNKLVDGRGNIVTSIEKLKKMGAKAKKSIPKAIIKRAEEDDFEQSKLEI
jgi:DNA recombination protein RmuC